VLLATGAAGTAIRADRRADRRADPERKSCRRCLRSLVDCAQRKRMWGQAGMVQAWVGHFVTPLKCTYHEYA